VTGVWSENETRRRFTKRAAELEARLPSLKRRSSEGPSMRTLHDEALAKLLIYRSLLDGAVLQTREAMLGALAALRRDPPLSPDAIEPESFTDRAQRFIDALIGQYR
jgi:hypothetical protein